MVRVRNSVRDQDRAQDRIAVRDRNTVNSATFLVALDSP